MPISYSLEEERWLENPIGDFPEKLSQLGVFVDINEEIPFGDMVAYEVRYPLFSDFNEKNRYLYLPKGQKINNDNPEDWVFPVGTALIKTFYLAPFGNTIEPRKKVETRILHKGTTAWRTGTYKWNDEGTEAIFTNGIRVEISYSLPEGDYDYAIPDRRACFSCHEGMTDFVIGFEEIQLHVERSDLSAGQVQYLRGLNLFVDNEGLRETEIEANSEIEQNAIGYLHGNCANCHNPSSRIYQTTYLDLRHENFKKNTVNSPPVKFSSTDSLEKVISPGYPSKSLIYTLMMLTDSNDEERMPPLGTSMIDTAGVRVVREWIEELGTTE